MASLAEWVAVALLTAAAAPDSARAPSDSATLRVTFTTSEKWSSTLDRPERARWQMPERVVDSLRIAPGARVADIGAGTGYFNRLLARAVGDSGRVFAEEIEPALVEHMRERALKEGTPQVTAVLGTPDDPHVPDRLDLVFVCNTYRYIDSRRAFFERVRGRLTPGGRLAIVDFHPSSKTGGTRLPATRVVRELMDAGYELTEEFDFLPTQYFLVFKARAGAHP